MLKWVDMVSFSAHEANLYLDTHPSDPAALQYFQEYTQLRKQALQDYAAMYGPLTVVCDRISRKVGLDSAAMAMGRRNLLNVEL